MNLRKPLIVALCAASLGGLAVPMTAGAAIYLSIAPPELRHEVVPAPRRGFVWIPGYWNARDNRHVWQRGRWERHRAGYHFVQPSWTQRDNRWELNRGRWNKGDRDGDGVPNRVDRAPNNPGRS